MTSIHEYPDTASPDTRSATAEVRFDESGTVHYHCSFHPGMDATVEVR